MEWWAGMLTLELLHELGVCAEKQAAKGLGRTSLRLEDVSPADRVLALVLNTVSDFFHFGDNYRISCGFVCERRDDKCGLIVTVMGYQPSG